MSEGDAAPAGPTPSSNNLVMRVIAALVLAPLAIALAYAGGWMWICLATLVAIGLYVEWLTVVGASRQVGLTALGGIAIVVMGLCLVVDWMTSLLLVAAFGLAAGALLAEKGKRGWAAAGFLYAGAALVASVLVRQDSLHGFSALMFVLLVVWATDIGGYFAGRSIGGPKLWPRVSPKKTWAGALGGLGASVAVAAAFAVLDLGRTLPLVLTAAVLSVVSQCGDLFESAVKRRFGVKDSSQLIPGHGGLMDRLDGFIAAIVVASIIGFLRRGMDGVGSGLMVW